VWTEPEPPGPDNPHGNAFRAHRRRLTTEREAIRRVDPASARWWEIVNPDVRHRLGSPVGYRLVPGENAVAYAAPRAAVSKRAAFIHQHLWVTPYRRDERFAAGEYPNQHPGGAGLPEILRAAARALDASLILIDRSGAVLAVAAVTLRPDLPVVIGACPLGPDPARTWIEPGAMPSDVMLTPRG